MGFLYREGTYTTIDVPGATYTEILAISGTNVAGVYGDANGGHGFLTTARTSPRSIRRTAPPPSLPGLAGNHAVGWYVGTDAQNHGFFYDGTSSTTYDPPGSINTQLTALDGVNMAGWYQGSDLVKHGFVYDGTTLTAIDPPGATQTQVSAISGTNVAGFYVDGSGQHAFVASLDAGKTAADADAR